MKSTEKTKPKQDQGQKKKKVQAGKKKQPLGKRQQPETLLRTPGEKFRRLFDNAGLGVFQSELDGRVIAVNQEFARLFGYKSPEEFVSLVKNSADIFADPQRRAEIIRLKAKDPGLTRFENLYRRKDGSTFLGSLTVQQVTAPDGGVPFFEGLIEDITERKRAEGELRSSEEQLRKIFNDGPLGMAVSNRQYHFIRANASFCQMLGYTEEELKKLSFKDITHPEDMGDSIKNVQELEKGNLSVYKTEKRYITKNKDVICGSLTLSLILDREGEFQYILVMIEDITQRKRAEMALAESEQKFRSLVEQSSDGIVIVDERGVVVDWNYGQEQLTGIKRTEALGRRMWDVQLQMMPDETRIPGTRERLEQNILRLLEVGRSPRLNQVLETAIQHPDGTCRDVQIIVFRFKTDNGFMAGSISRDITDRKLVEKSLLASEMRYRSLFEDSPISLWEEDFSAVKRHIEKLKRQGVTDFRDFFNSHPDVVIECMKKIKVTDVNKTTLALMRAANKAQLIGNLKQILRINSGENFVDEFVSIAEGKTEFEWEGINHTLGDEVLTISLRWSAAPGYEDTLEKVLVSIIDITDRKRAETALALRTEELRQRNEELTRINEQAERRMQRLVSMRTIDMAISGSFDVGVVLGIVLDQVTGQLGSHAADILLFSQGAQTFKFSSGRGFRVQGLEHSHYKFGADLAWRVIRERRKVEISDLKTQANTLQRSPDLSGEGFLSYIGVPLVSKGQVRGVLEVFHRERLYPDREWYNYLETLAGQAAIAVDNAALFERMQSSNTELIMAYDSTLVGWANALELRRLEPAGHTRRVDNLTTRLAQVLGLSDNDQVHIHRGTLLHDIGMLGVPDGIVLKAGPLTEGEWEIMRKHPQVSFDMLSPIAYLRPALDIPYYHHEKWDGTGYPRGLIGGNIPLPARIFAVVDVWDALTSDRPYRKAWSEMKASEHIRQQAGLHFDPSVVKIFLGLSPDNRTGV